MEMNQAEKSRLIRKNFDQSVVINAPGNSMQNARRNSAFFLNADFKIFKKVKKMIWSFIISLIAPNWILNL